MRVLHVASGNLFGGVETMLVMMARHRELCPDMEPSFAICFEGRLAEELRALDVDVHCLGEVRLSRWWSVLAARRNMAALLQRFSFDRVICHSVWPVAVFAPVFAQTSSGSNLRWGFWLHDRITGRHWLELLSRRHRPHFGVCNSRFSAQTLPRLFPSLKDPLICYPLAGVPEPRVGRSSVRAALNTPEQDTIIIQVSRLEEWKGQMQLLDALARLTHLPGWTCWQVGGPQRRSEVSYFERLQNRAVDLGISNRVRFTGARRDVPDLLAAADIHCQPNSGPEPFGLAFIEALYSALPVVTTAFGGALEILDSSCAVLVPVGDPDALSDALEGLIRNPLRRHRLGANGPARAACISGPSGRLRELCRSLAVLPDSPQSAMEAAFQ